ncbi:hypothetical protein LJB42_001178 [Komagataella kurtzmanii]|nr:hypothetical protein LJB42_001178 [Komagataella kurtzmanii]
MPTVLSLEELVLRCCRSGCQDLDDHQGRGSSDASTSKFENIVKKLYNSENLAYLKKVYEYEQEWNRVHEDDVSDLFGGETERCKDCICEGEPPFTTPVKDIDDFQENTAKKMRISSLERRRNDDQEFEFLNSELSDDTSDGSELTFLWRQIIDNYIRESSTSQINVSASIRKNLLLEDDFPGPHHPQVFSDSKNSVLRLLRDNVYMEFLSDIRGRDTSQENLKFTGASGKKIPNKDNHTSPVDPNSITSPQSSLRPQTSSASLSTSTCSSCAQIALDQVLRTELNPVVSPTPLGPCGVTPATTTGLVGTKKHLKSRFRPESSNKEDIEKDSSLSSNKSSLLSKSLSSWKRRIRKEP